MQHYIFGIDFGTSTTAISHTKDTTSFEPEIIEIENKKMVETVLRVTPDGQQVELIGSEAWDNAHNAPNRTFFEFKLMIGSGKKYLVDGQSLTAEGIGKLFLSHLREKIEQAVLNNETLAEISKVNKVTTVIGYPAEWNEIQKKATVQMASGAGFPNVYGCGEPLGAIYFHYYQGEIDLEKKQYVLVYDFGGGTTDTAIVEINPGVDPRVHSVAGIPNLGGKNYDERICADMVDDICKQTGKDSLPQEDIIRIRSHCRQIKERLSINIENRKDSAQETIPRLKCKNSEHLMTLTKNNFEKLHSDLLNDFAEPIWEVLSKAKIQAKEINMVISTGGSGRFYFVPEKLKEIFPDAIHLRSINPQECIAKGLSLYAKIRVHGRESVKPKIKYETNQNSETTFETTADGTGQAKSGIDPYVQEAEKKKKAGFGKKIFKFIKWTILSTLLFFFGLFVIGLLFGDKNDKGKKAETAVSVVPQSATGQIDKDDVAIKKIHDYHKKLDEANNEKNLSLIDAIKSEIQAIDTNGCINEVVLTKSALTAYCNEPIEFSRKYGMHPYDKTYYAATTSKEVDNFDQRFEKDTSALEKFNMYSADEYYYYCLAKYLESKKIDHKISVTKYSIIVIDIIEGSKIQHCTNSAKIFYLHSECPYNNLI